MLEDGYHDIPPGKIAAIVTFLQMLEKPQPRAEASGPWTLSAKQAVDLDTYRAVWRSIGEDWLWASRLVMSDEELASHVHASGVELYLMEVAGRAEGIVELDFRKAGDCEMLFFGLSPSQIGNGAGRWLMNRAIERAWSQPIHRFWLHTCTLDSPQALSFYQRSGFTPFSRQVEIFDDPRLAGHMSRDKAPHVPVLDP